MSRLRFVLAQLGPKPGAREQLASLVEAAELPGSGWREVDRRTWRTGRQSPDEAWAQRAADMGSVTAWRSFADGGRWLWVQVVPFASAEDASTALAVVPTRWLKNAFAAVRIIDERDVAPPPIPDASEVWAVQQRTAGPPGEGTVLMVGFVQGARLVVLCAGGDPEWSWSCLAEVTSAQSSKLPK